MSHAPQLRRIDGNGLASREQHCQTFFLVCG
jgi:hypothetical protein